MLLRIIEFFAAILKKLLPDSSLSTSNWTIRLVVVTLLTLGIGSTAYFGLRGTELGDRAGINPVPVVLKLPQLTHTDFIASIQEMWQQITGLREANADIKATFIVVLTDKETGNIVSSVTTDLTATRIVTWIWSISVDKFSSLDIFTQAFNELKPRIEPRLKNVGRCLSGEIERPIFEFLKRGVNNFQSTHFSICPIFTQKDYRLIGATIAFYKNPNNQELFYYEDQLARSTKFIASRFNNFSTPYQFIFN